MPDFTAAQVRTMLLRAARDTGSQREFAAKLGVSESFLSHVLAGSKEPSGKVLRFLKLKRVVRYEGVHPALNTKKDLFK